MEAGFTAGPCDENGFAARPAFLVSLAEGTSLKAVLMPARRKMKVVWSQHLREPMHRGRTKSVAP